jgi:hypothetical protein
MIKYDEILEEWHDHLDGCQPCKTKEYCNVGQQYMEMLRHLWDIEGKC